MGSVPICQVPKLVSGGMFQLYFNGFQVSSSGPSHSQCGKVSEYQSQSLSLSQSHPRDSQCEYTIRCPSAEKCESYFAKLLMSKSQRMSGQKAKWRVLSPGVHIMYLCPQVRRPRDACCPLVFTLCICVHRSEGQETRAVPWCSHYVLIPYRSEGQETRAVPWWRGVGAWRAGRGGGDGMGSPVHRVLTRRQQPQRDPPARHGQSVHDHQLPDAECCGHRAHTVVDTQRSRHVCHRR